MDAPGRARFLFLNVAHAYDHLFMLLFPTVVLALQAELDRPYEELLTLATGGFVAFAAGTLPAGWLGDRWSRSGMLMIFFFGIGASSILTGLASTTFGIAVGLALIGLFASIYHPVGIALVVSGTDRVGRALGINGVYGNLGVALAALIAGALSDMWNWRAAFIVPGLVALATGALYALLLPRMRAAEAKRPGKAASASIALDRALQVRVFAVIAVATLFGGLIFNATTVALPKAFADGLTGLVDTTFGVGAIAALVYTAAAFAQVVVGWLIDRHPIKPVFVVVVLLQVPALLLVQRLVDGPMLIVAFALMLLVFGQIPINDAMVARNTAEHWRSRVYAMKYIFSIGVTSLVVPLVARLYGAEGNFSSLFQLLAACAAVILVGALLLPGPARTAALVTPAVAGSKSRG